MPCTPRLTEHFCRIFFGGNKKRGRLVRLTLPRMIPCPRQFWRDQFAEDPAAWDEPKCTRYRHILLTCSAIMTKMNTSLDESSTNRVPDLFRHLAINWIKRAGVQRVGGTKARRPSPPPICLWETRKTWPITDRSTNLKPNLRCSLLEHCNRLGNCVICAIIWPNQADFILFDVWYVQFVRKNTYKIRLNKPAKIDHITHNRNYTTATHSFPSSVRWSLVLVGSHSDLILVNWSVGWILFCPGRWSGRDQSVLPSFFVLVLIIL